MMTNNTIPMGWLPNKATMLDSLLDIVNSTPIAEDTDQDGTSPSLVPWRDGHAIELSAFGGLESLENRTVSIALESYSNYISSNLTQNISGNYTSTFDGAARYTFGAPEGGVGNTPSETGNSDATVARPMALYGDDTLTVKANSDIRFKNRSVIMVGQVQRTWLGGIARMASMEGIICGGFFTRAFLGPSLTIAAIGTGDIYGGALRVSGVRMNIAGMGYRSADLSNWAIGYYACLTNFHIIPAAGSPSANKPLSAKDWAKKLTFGLLPFLEIFLGLLMLPVGIFMLIVNAFKALANKIRGVPKKLPSGPVGPPRLLNRTVGVTQQAAGNVLIT